MSSPTPSDASLPLDQPNTKKAATRTDSAVRAPNAPELAFAAACLFLIWYVATSLRGVSALQFSSSGLQNLGTVLTPLVAVSLFIERAVEVFITVWRDPGAQALKHDMEAAPERAAAIGKRLDSYKLHTQRLSFLASFTAALVAAMVGVRAVEPLLEATKLPAAGAQLTVLHGFDMVVTALLIAGGADGMHQIVTTFTGWLQATKDKINPSPANNGGGNGEQ